MKEIRRKKMTFDGSCQTVDSIFKYFYSVCPKYVRSRQFT